MYDIKYRIPMQLLIVASLFISALTISCHPDAPHTGVRTIEVPPFDTLLTKGAFHLRLVQDTVYKFVIHADERIINDIIYSGNNRKATIENSISGQWLKLSDKPGVDIHFEHLSQLTNFGPVSLICPDTLILDRFALFALGEIAETRLLVRCNYLRIDNSHNTLGHFFIAGSAGYAHLYNKYGCSGFAAETTINTIDVINRSAGDIYLNVTRQINADIQGSGNIYYSGNPVIKIVKHTGTGKIIQLQ